jgi:hypothetical protein
MGDGFAEGLAVGQNNGNNANAWGGEWIWIIVLFALFGWGGNGYGNQGRGQVGGQEVGYELGKLATTNDVASGFASNAMIGGLNDIKLGQAGIQQSICNSTRDIIDGQRESTNAILGFLTNEKISSLQAQNAQLTAQLSQNAQTQTLINTLRPVASPAYITCSPYESAYGTRNGGCGCGCGC